MLASSVGIVGYRTTENRLRHFERLKRLPGRLIVLGDATCALEPVYGQGMSAAVLGAEALGRYFERWRRSRRYRPVGGLEFQRELARSNASTWTLATSSDYRFRKTQGPAPRLWTWFMHRHVDQVMRLSTRDPRVREHLLQVIHLLRPQRALFSPDVLLRLFCSSLGALAAGWFFRYSRQVVEPPATDHIQPRR